VLPAPADWAGLSATLTLPATSPYGVVPAAVFTLLNRTGAAITLSPCPEYTVFVETDQTDLARWEVLGCSGHGTVPAHGATSFSVPAQSYSDGDPRGRPAPRTAVTVRVAIAGVRTATAITRTR
jgi:hypothetical protein